jgi:hypothetical protein
MKKRYFLQKMKKYERIRGMKYNYKNYIRVFYENSPDKYGWSNPSTITRKPEEKKWYEKLGDAAVWLGNILSNVDNEMRDVLIEVKDALLSNNDKVKATLSILNATGTLKTSSISEFTWDIPSLLARWKWDAGKSWMRQILVALRKAKQWEVSIIVFSNNEYKTQSIGTYNELIYNNTSQINKWVIKWLFSLRGTNVPGLTEETWSKIGLYILNRPETTITEGLSAANIDTLKQLWTAEKSKKEAKIQIELTWILDKPRFKEFLVKKGIIVNGKINLQWELDNLKKNNTSIKWVEDYLNTLGDRLIKEAKTLLDESKEQAKKANIDKKTFKDIWIEWIIIDAKDGKTIDVSDMIITGLSEEYTKEVLVNIKNWLSKRDKQSPTYEQERNNVEAIQAVLWIKIKAFEKVEWAIGAKIAWKKLEQHRINWGTTANFELPNKEKLERAWSIAKARFQQESTQTDLREYGIDTLDKAQRELQKIQEKEQNSPLNTREKHLKNLLKQYIEDTSQIAKEYRRSVFLLWEKQAQDIFSQSNRFVSKKNKEKYNFETLEKIAIITHPESTKWERWFARLKNWGSISLENIFEKRNNDTTAYNVYELRNTKIIKNPNNTYSMKWEIQAENLSKGQLREYILIIKQFSEVWLSQLTPHLKMIYQEFRKQWINVALDGQREANEKQLILKKIYTLFFWKTISTNSYNEIQNAFSSALGNPTNMKNAMQNVLIKHKLISWSNQPIRADNLKNFISNQEKSPDPTTDFHFI